jgi:hypothetical protein
MASSSHSREPEKETLKHYLAYTHDGRISLPSTAAAKPPQWDTIPDLFPSHYTGGRVYTEEELTAKVREWDDDRAQWEARQQEIERKERETDKKN